MSHPAVDNKTPFEFSPVFATDEELHPMLVPVVKSTFAIDAERARLSIAREQKSVELAGEYYGDPETTSFKYEPEIAFTKPATDVTFIGSARPSHTGMQQFDFGFRVGPVAKVARVFGDRSWQSTLGGVRMSEAKKIDEPIPVTAERAFGGWDQSRKEKVRYEPRNPVGTSYRAKLGKFEDAIALPNIEDPTQLLRSFRERVRPALFGFSSPSWEPRNKLAGTYGKKWLDRRSPKLPEDFDRRFFNAASPGLITDGYLHGDEEVVIKNGSNTPRLSFDLPGLAPPHVRVILAWGEERRLSTVLDTVIVNTQDDIVILIWRAHTKLASGPLDVREIEIALDGPRSPLLDEWEAQRGD